MAFPTGWGRKCAIVIDNTNVDSDLTNFPVLVHATGGAYNGLPEEMFDADGSYPALEGGGDIRFSSDSAGSSRLACDVVAFHIDNDPANGYAAIYVNVGTVTAASTTTIYVWYNKAGETQPARDAAYGKEATWNSDFKAVWHLNESGNGSDNEFKDSTSNDNHGTGGGAAGSGDSGKTPAQATGKIFKGQNFDGSNDFIHCGSGASLDISQPMTLSAWIDLEDTSLRTIYTTEHGGVGGYHIRCNNRYIELSKQNVAQIGYTDGQVITLDTWVHVSISYDTDGAYQFYVDSVDRGDGTNDQDCEYGDHVLGEYATESEPWDSLLEEVRISGTIRDAAWAKAEYYNMSDPGTFCAEGTPESPSGGDLSVEVSECEK